MLRMTRRAKEDPTRRTAPQPLRLIRQTNTSDFNDNEMFKLQQKTNVFAKKTNPT